MSSFAFVEFPNSNIQLTRIYSVNFRQHMYEHDYGRFTFRDWGVDPAIVKPGVLMHVAVDGKDFYGYVHDVKNYQESQMHVTEVGFIGASYVMRQASQKVYYNTTADQIIVDIAKRYGFSYRAAPHPRVYKQVAQAGLTDWEFMVKLAKQSGYALRAENTALYFQPLLQDFSELITEALSFAKIDAGFMPLNPIYNFRPIIGETLSTNGFEKAATSVAGIDPNTGQYFKYTKQNRSTPTRRLSNAELFDKHATTVVANDYGTAIHEATSADSNTTFPYTATAEVYGKGVLRPGMPIHLDGVGNLYSGYWAVIGVEHHVVEKSINLQTYTSIVTVGTDSLGSLNGSSPDAKPGTRQIRYITPNVRNTRVKPHTVLKSPLLNLKPTKTSQLVNRTNRAAPKDKALSTATWKGSVSNLTPPSVPATRSPAALIKAGAHNARG